MEEGSRQDSEGELENLYSICTVGAEQKLLHTASDCPSAALDISKPLRALVLAAATITLWTAISPRVAAQDCAEPLTVSGVCYRITEEDDPDLTSVAWRATVTNHADHPVRFVARVQFKDADGYQVDIDGFTSAIGPGKHKDFAGAVDEQTSEADRIASEVMGCYRP